MIRRLPFDVFGDWMHNENWRLLVFELVAALTAAAAAAHLLRVFMLCYALFFLLSLFSHSLQIGIYWTKHTHIERERDILRERERYTARTRTRERCTFHAHVPRRQRSVGTGAGLCVCVYMAVALADLSVQMNMWWMGRTITTTTKTQTGSSYEIRLEVKHTHKKKTQQINNNHTTWFDVFCLICWSFAGKWTINSSRREVRVRTEGYI